MTKKSETIILLERLAARTMVNRLIFVITMLINLILGILVMWTFTDTHRSITEHSRFAEESFKEIHAGAEANRARIDANTDIILGFIQRFTDYMDYLQKENPQIKVPKTDEPHVTNIPKPNTKDLDRPQWEHPKFGVTTPSPTPKVITKTKYIKQQKEKGFWERVFSSPTPKPKR